MKYLVLALISLTIASSAALALAHGSGAMSGMMGCGMQGCMQMMQGMSGTGAQPPNRQWRHRQVAPDADKPGAEAPGRSSPE